MKLTPLLLMSLMPSLSYAEFYQCTNQQGFVIYQDVKCKESDALIDKSDVVKELNTSAPPVYKAGSLDVNLLKNSSFENELVDWKVPTGVNWVSNKGVNAGAALVFQATIPPEDKYIHETTVEQCVVLGQGEKFKLSAQFKAEKKLVGKYASSARFANRANIIWYESEDCSRGGQFGGYIEPTNTYGWQSLTGNDLKPAFQAKAAKITIVQNGRYSRGHKAFWDNISFVASEVFEQSNKSDKKPNAKYTLASNKNYIKNSSFKKDLSSWHAWRAKWVFKGNKSQGSAKVVLISKKAGLGVGVLDQCINIGGNTQFDFGASMKKDRGSTRSGGGRIRVSWNEKENCSGRSKIDNKSADVNDVYGWQNLQVNNLVAPQGAQSVHIELIQSVSGKGKFILYWDDVFFKAVR
ncbi:MAG: hypothetical protein DIZ80_09485 [endosymbiont of Galathealinum brachiosum]|uniref:DUF4124 domain-containing protein n=1 Tax=endosymbiont of Galathealinum brachiosum TaxID=2200906 RepID=A0A370DC79_9GAMM|nr:MAG: hypothetical protein DIZ80_09485 [endosymbiont of Galathealinum brachiosum]